MTEEYGLYDGSNTLVAKNKILYRLKLPMESGKAYMVRGQYSGLELKVTTETPSQDWRCFEARVLEEMDALSDYINVLIDNDYV